MLFGEGGDIVIILTRFLLYEICRLVYVRLVGQEQRSLPIEFPKHPVYEVNSFVARRGEGVEEVACSCAGDFTFGMDKERKGGKKRREERGEKDWKGRDGQNLCTPHIMYARTHSLPGEENRLPCMQDVRTLKSGCGKTSRDCTEDTE